MASLDYVSTLTISQVQCEEELDGLHDHLLAVEHLHDRFISYQTAFNKLILELARRRQYREAAENIVRRMVGQLEAMTEGKEIVTRSVNPQDFLLHRGEPSP